jgi:ligand-binding sensor domain-containing protein/two-component sensor histidine kinase
MIYSIEQDGQGYIWIGTDAGLNRFDGNSFKNYYQGTAPLDLPSGSVWRIKRFGPDQLAVTTKGGFQLINTKNYTVSRFVINDSTPIIAYLNSAWEAAPLPGKSYLVSTATGAYVFNEKGEVTYRHDAYTVNDIGKKRVLYGREIFKLSETKFIIYLNEAQLGLYDHAKGTYRELKPSDPEHRDYLQQGSPGDAWLLKHQVSPNEFIFVPHRENSIVYFDNKRNLRITSPLAQRIVDSINWESRLVMLNDSTALVNSRTNGFYVFHVNRKTGHIWTDGRKFLRNYKILCMLIDRDNRLWAGTTEGLLKQNLQPPIMDAFHYQPLGGEKYTGGFSTIFRYKNLIYASRFSSGKGLVILDAATMERIKEIDFYGVKSSWNEIRSIEMYHQDTLWIGSNGGLLWFDTKTEKFGRVLIEKQHPGVKHIYAVLGPPRKDGYAWMLSQMDGKVLRYHIPTRSFTLYTSETDPALPFDKVKSIAYDSYGDVWIGGHSLARFNNRLQKFDTLIKVYAGPNKFNDDIVTMRADENGSLWLHNTYNGLLQYRIAERKFIHYSMKDGLPSDGLLSMSPVIRGKLWVAANNAICLFDVRSKQFTVYDDKDGLPEQKPTSRRISYDSVGGMLYMGCNEYIVRFPFDPGKKKDNSSGVLIEELTIGSRHSIYQPSGSLSLKHNENNLAIHCAVIDFEKGNYQYAYRLNSTDPWNAIGTQRVINLVNLPRGSYRFQVKATGKPGIEKIQSLAFTIRPPYWQTGWFISLALLLVVTMIYVVYLNRVRQIRQKANIDKQLSQMELKALQAQMNPHFIFNSLNSIREMILNAENKEASHFLSKFAHLMRMTLDQSSQSMVSLRNTIEYLQRYMEMESIRNSQFTYKVDVDPQLDIDETLVPPMLIQPFIENSLWHGVSAKNRSIHVNIAFRKNGDTLICTIDDNGIGIDQAQKQKQEQGSRHQSHGIANIKDRMKLLNEKYALKAHFSVADKKTAADPYAKGTLVTLYLPLEIEDDEQDKNIAG